MPQNFAIPVNLNISIDTKSSASTAAFIFVAILTALLIYGAIYKK
jgi:hypothetical protein